MPALYRKYRPQTFAEVVGQEAVVRTLTNAIEQGKIRQAYLFAGPRGTGKTSLARILAKAVNCAHGPTASPDGTKLYVTVGSNSNVGENGMAAEEDRADVLEVDRATGEKRVFASGLRNPNGLSWQPQSGALWVAVNERDELGNDLVPDYMTSLKEGGFYGWPYSYFGQHIDTRVSPQRPDLVAKAISPA